MPLSGLSFKEKISCALLSFFILLHLKWSKTPLSLLMYTPLRFSCFFYYYGIISFLKEDQDTSKAVAPKRVSG